MQQQAYESRILDHLGLVAAMFDELELGQVIDRRIPQDFEQRKVTVGQAVKAMVLNGLGFVNQRLYLVPAFFETKPTERLIGEGILPEHLNDDTLGRALDTLYETGVTELFRDLAAHAAARLGLRPRMAHLDATSFHLDGQYNSEEEPHEGVIHIRPGYSRDHRPELNQVVLDLMVEHQAGLPLLMQPLSGNASDQGSFPDLIKAHLSHLQQAHGVDYVVADAALYSADHIQELAESATKFITRVPETLSEAKRLLAAAQRSSMAELSDGYWGLVRHSSYGEVPQRWLVVHSEAAQARAAKTTPKQMARKHEAEKKAFRKLSQRFWACRQDSERALAEFEASLVASKLEQKQVLECLHMSLAEGAGDEVSYCIEGQIVPCAEKEADLVWRRSLFILTTNELDEEALSNEELLLGYKGQHQVERGFRFLKDPAFLASSLFLKNEKRIMALLMVMTLCLLVYAALEWRIREGLRQTGQSIPDQKGKPTERPTARWVFYTFEGIHVLLVGGQQLVLNLRERHQVILQVLGPRYQSHYHSHSP